MMKHAPTICLTCNIVFHDIMAPTTILPLRFWIEHVKSGGEVEQN